ncbi:MAG TPA: hypothetical protein PL041_06410 [Melioribacteraceae bacterium]|nr:hypothetical protein [Melioribacteraceae bacterium]
MKKEKALVLELFLIKKQVLSVLVFLVVIVNYVNAQDSSKSEAIKPKDFWNKKPLVKPVYPPYPLMAGFLLVKEANQGDPFAQHELGLRYIMGNGFSPDTALGISWLQRAVKSGIPAAHFNYGIMLLNGTGVNWNPFEAFYHFKFAATAGLPEGMYLLGVLYTDNLLISRNFNLAFYWLNKASKSGFLPAKQIIDEIIKNGFLPPADESVKEDDLITAISNNTSTVLDPGYEPELINFEKDSTSVNKEDKFISKLLQKKINEIRDFIGCKIDSIDLSVDSVKAVEIIKKAADNSSPEAVYAYAKIILSTKDNQIKYAETLLKAMRLGYNSALFSLNTVINNSKFNDELIKLVNKKEASALYVISQIRLLNLKFDITYEQAIEYLKLSANKNNVNAINELAVIYFTGKYDMKNKNEAIKLWESIKLNDSEANQRLLFAKLIENTKEINKEDIEILKNASDNGSVIADAAMGYVYENGIFTNEKKSLAEKYYRKGSRRGNNYAYLLLKKLYDDLRPNDEEFIIYTEE